ncbi:hypothetical protein, partial [Streptomyces halstedii]|uniref:hypothetical protein n=1 Tax=Streptomyces halstedii TaxID=1944 RepID=UPI00368E62FA
MKQPKTSHAKTPPGAPFKNRRNTHTTNPQKGRASGQTKHKKQFAVRQKHNPQTHPHTRIRRQAEFTSQTRDASAARHKLQRNHPTQQNSPSGEFTSQTKGTRQRPGINYKEITPHNRIRRQANSHPKLRGR